jgi:hypothetical protein
VSRCAHKSHDHSAPSFFVSALSTVAAALPEMLRVFSGNLFAHGGRLVVRVRSDVSLYFVLWFHFVVFTDIETAARSVRASEVFV